MKVKITSCNHSSNWYAGQMGKILDVSPEMHPSQNFIGEYLYALNDNSGYKIYTSDCEVYNEYPTLSKEYDTSFQEKK